MSEGDSALLIKHDIGSTDYSIWLSDLNDLWCEEANRKHIIRESLRLDTSIDPSESPDQLTLLLEKIHGILQGEDGTKVSVEYGNTGESPSLKLYSPLPGSLKPLEWECKLNKQPPNLLTRHMTMPLINQLSTQDIMQSALLQELKDKDYVIEKLIATMASEGVSLGRAFMNSMSSKSMSKQITRDSLGKSVRGLVEFNEESWQSRMKEVTRSPQSRSELLSRVFDRLSGNKLKDDTIISPQGAGDQVRIMHQAKLVKLITIKDETPILTTRTDLPDRGAQKLFTRSSPAGACDDSSTTSEGTPDSHHNDETLQKGEKSSPIQLNGRSLSPDGQPDNEQTQRSPEPNQGHVKLGSPKSSSHDQDLAQPKSKLGKIGGRKTASSASDDITKAVSANPIAGVDARRSPVSHASRPVEHLEKSSSPRETTPERANRRRRELDEQLQVQAKAPPKKKRRF